MKIKYLLFFFGVTSLVACQKNVTDIIIPYNEQLVLRGFITPQDTLTEIQVSRTTPIIGTINPDYRIEANATLNITDGQKTTTIKYQTFKIKNPNFIAGNGGGFGGNNNIDTFSDSVAYFGYFFTSKTFPIVAGKTYTIKASTKDGLAAEATCTVPIMKLNAKDIEVVTGTTVNRNRVETTYQAKWPDAANETNYYAVAIKNQLTYNTVDSQTGKVSPSIANYSVGAGYYNDAFLNGQVISSERFTKRDRTNGRGQATIVVAQEYVDIEFYETDKVYYNFNKSLAQQQSIDGNPFAEPVVVQSNVKGGLGGFGGANKITVRLKL